MTIFALFSATTSPQRCSEGGTLRAQTVRQLQWLRRAPLFSCCLAALLSLSGCCRQSTPASHPQPAQSGGQFLSPTQAAQLAAKLANDECQRIYGKRPFTADQRPAVWMDNEYRWGGLDVGGPGGFSALVIFRGDGSHPKVEVYFSTDSVKL